MRQSIPVTLSLKEATVEEVLDECFKSQPLTYAIVKKSVVIKFKRFALPEENIAADAEVTAPPPIDVKGKITDENGKVLDGATIRVKGKTRLHKQMQTVITS